MASMNEVMKMQLTERGESIITDLGLASKLLLRNSDLHEELSKIARNFAAQDSTLNSTFQMFKQMNVTIHELHDRIERSEVNLHELPKMAELLTEAELISSTPMSPQTIKMMHIDALPPSPSPDTESLNVAEVESPPEKQ